MHKDVEIDAQKSNENDIRFHTKKLWQKTGRDLRTGLEVITILCKYSVALISRDLFCGIFDSNV